MNVRTTLASAAMALAVLTSAGCAVYRGQETTGAYIDDTTITAQVKSRMLNSPDVSGTSISVETMNGTVMLSGFATRPHHGTRPCSARATVLRVPSGGQAGVRAAASSGVRYAARRPDRAGVAGT